MVHQYKNNGYNIVMDICSGAIHVVDDVVIVAKVAQELVKVTVRVRAYIHVVAHVREVVEVAAQIIAMLRVQELVPDGIK